MHTILIAALLCGPPASRATCFNPPADPQPVAAFDVRLLRVESDAGGALALTRTVELTEGGSGGATCLLEDPPDVPAAEID